MGQGLVTTCTWENITSGQRKYTGVAYPALKWITKWTGLLSLKVQGSILCTCSHGVFLAPLQINGKSQVFKWEYTGSYIMCYCFHPSNASF